MGEHKIAFNNKEMPLETLLELIDNDLINEEIPFALLAQEYPDLLEKWYPGFPGAPRLMREGDPFCVDGMVKGDFIVIKEMPGLGKLEVPDAEKNFGAGKCIVWFNKENGNWTITLEKKLKKK